MYFTRTDTGFRGWFQIVRSNGELRTDVLSSSFTALVVDSLDTTSSLMTVTQSQQKQGLYRFDVPPSFLVNNGSGEYGISVEVDAATPPKVKTAFSEILKVSEEDFNSLSGSIWSTQANQFNVSGTMGYLQNQTTATEVSGTVSASVDVDSIVSGVWEAFRISFTGSVGSMGWTMDQIFQTSSQNLINTETIIDLSNDLIFSSSQIFNIVTDVSANVDHLIFSSSQIYNNTEIIVSNIDDLIFSSSQIFDNTEELITSSSQIFNNTENIFSELLTVVSATVSGATLTQAQLNSVVSGVWNASSSSFNTSGTMGWLQNQTFESSQDLIFSSSQIFGNTNNLLFSSSQIYNNTEQILATGSLILNDLEVVISGNDELLISSSQIFDNTVTLIDTTNNLIFSSSQIFNNTEQLVSSGSEISQASINTLVSGVWNAASGAFNTSGTMGWLQNQTYTNSSDILDDTLLLISGVNSILGQTTNIEDIVASGSVNLSLDSINTFVSSVWQANDVTFNTSGTMGYLQNLIDNIKSETSQTLNNTTSIASGVTASLTFETVDTIVSGVWNATSGTFNVSGTMGYLQNQITAASASVSASVTVDNQAIADAVWNTLTSSMTVSGSAGAVLFTKTDALATKICEIYQILGLEIGSPLTVSDVQRTVAAITQSIDCDASNVVTVTRTS